jgi:hypothetical protein
MNKDRFWREIEVLGECQECVCEERLYMNIKVECKMARKIIYDFFFNFKLMKCGSRSLAEYVIQSISNFVYASPGFKYNVTSPFSLLPRVVFSVIYRR